MSKYRFTFLEFSLGKTITVNNWNLKKLHVIELEKISIQLKKIPLLFNGFGKKLTCLNSTVK